MAETAKIISPNKKVLLPDVNAGCSLADDCPADKFEAFVKAHPNHTVISYVNCSAGVKALTDIVVTSSNAEKIVNSLPKEKKIIFAPDKNLGRYVAKKTGRNLVLWDVSCMVHELFSLEKITKLKIEYPNAQLIERSALKNNAHNIGGAWATFEVKLTRPVSKKQALLIARRLNSAKRNCCHLMAIDFTSNPIKYNKTIRYDGTYSHGVV